MAQLQNFRSALGGFNREDVVHYIELLNNKHNTQVNQLNTELQALRSQLEQAQAVPPVVPEITEQLSAAEAHNAALQAEIELLKQQLAEALAAKEKSDNRELEAYRRAERAERLAQERAQQLAVRVNGILADATVKVDDAAGQISLLADQTLAQVTQFRDAVLSSKAALADAAATMYSIKPISEEV